MECGDDMRVKARDRPGGQTHSNVDRCLNLPPAAGDSSDLPTTRKIRYLLKHAPFLYK